MSRRATPIATVTMSYVRRYYVNRGIYSSSKKNRFNCRCLSPASLPHLHARRAAECYVPLLTVFFNSRMSRRRRGAVPGSCRQWFGCEGDQVSRLVLHRSFTHACISPDRFDVGKQFIETLKRLAFVFWHKGPCKV